MATPYNPRKLVAQATRELYDLRTFEREVRLFNPGRADALRRDMHKWASYMRWAVNEVRALKSTTGAGLPG